METSDTALKALSRAARERIAPVLRTTVNRTVDRNFCARGGFISNVGATATVQIQLPPATPGLQFFAIVKAAQILRPKPYGTETMALPSSGVQGAAGKGVEADAVGESGHWVCTTPGTWDYVGPIDGTWTAEA